MAGSNTFEARRLENIQRNGALLEEIGINQQAKIIHDSTPASEPAKKRRKVEKSAVTLPPSRSSARITSTLTPTTYNEDALSNTPLKSRTKSKSKATSRTTKRLTHTIKPPSEEPEDPPKDIESLKASWDTWTPTAPPPTRSEDGTFHFPSHPLFTPNLSPSEVLTQGAFGGTYFRPLYSSTLRTTIRDDYLSLPPSWIANLNVERYLTSGEYDAEVNKFGVGCGQSIEEWEKAGWIRHEWDVRGWFQWYCRFFEGRRGGDDERQVGRWGRCVGERGRWRRALLKAYVKVGVRDIIDDGSEVDTKEVSPVMHQTCHHWAWCITQDALDDFWGNG